MNCACINCRASRPAPELEALIGYFINPVALRTQLSGSMTFRELVKRVRKTVVGAQAHAEASAPTACLAWLHEHLVCRPVCVSWWSAPQKSVHGVQVPLLTVLESAQYERMRGRSPLFQTWFDIQPGNLESPLALEGVHVQPFQKAIPPPRLLAGCA